MVNDIANGVRGLLPFLPRPHAAPAEERAEPIVQPELVVTVHNGIVRSAELDGVPINVVVHDYDAARKRKKAFEDLPYDDEGHRFVVTRIAADF